MFQYLLCYRTWVKTLIIAYSSRQTLEVIKYSGCEANAEEVLRGMCFSWLNTRLGILSTALLMHFEGELLIDTMFWG